jgi:predicted outer membrane repeat protein
MKTIKMTIILIFIMGLCSNAAAVTEYWPVKFRATVTADERHDVIPVCYGDYFVEVNIDEVLEDNGGILTGVTSVEVCYVEELDLVVGDRVEVYGVYYPAGSVCPKQYCRRVIANMNPWYVKLLCGKGQILYVDHDATGANDGSSWFDAYQYLEEALSAANSGDEIWVAEGTYKPYIWKCLLMIPPQCFPVESRIATFQLKNCVAIYGGFAGSETSRNQRNWMVHKCILSGDIGTIGDNSDNIYHVVTGSGCDSTAVLDGFTITGGNADESSPPYYSGGGMYNNSGSPTVSNCKFINNSAKTYGGGMYGTKSAPKVTNCLFIDNSANYGGGMNNDEEEIVNMTAPVVTNCTFKGNTARVNGGGMHNYACDTIVTNCIFWENRPNQIEQRESELMIRFCCIQGGTVSTTLHNTNAKPMFTDTEGRLSVGSPCIDAGNNSAVPIGITTDLDGNPRFVDIPATPDTGLGTPPIVDMGAYEFDSGPSCSTPPAPPTSVTATAVSSSSKIILRWNKSTCATGYKIFYDEDISNPPFSPTNDGNPASGSDVGNVTQVTISGLSPGQTYCFAVKAYNAAGESDYSAQDCATVSSQIITCSYAVGDRVVLLVDNPREATNLPAGTCGTVLCTDSADPELPILVSWDGWSGGYNRDQYCDYPPPCYPNNSAYWMACDQIAPGCTQGYFNQCGVLVQGVECVLFQADTDGLYVLDNIGDFQVGDRVRVRGIVSLCMSICMQGDGCIKYTIISLCDETFCCSPPYSPGDRVRLLVSYPRGAVGLVAGKLGTVICCDYDDPELPVFVSWDGWSNGRNSDIYCDSAIWSYPADSGWWMACDEIEPLGYM